MFKCTNHCCRNIQKAWRRDISARRSYNAVKESAIAKIHERQELDSNKYEHIRWSTVNDYVIVGGGSAGCVLADRLSEGGKNKVLLLEAGKRDWFWQWKIHMPAALTYNLCNAKYNWYYHTEEQKHMNNRKLYWPRGKVLGGSSALNAMVYIRGHAEDYNRWEREGATGWSYEDCLPYFRKAQNHQLGADAYRGGDGPLHVSRGSMENPLFGAFLEAGQQAGYPYTEDINGYQQEGVGEFDRTIHKGKRWSTSQAYLKRIKGRKNIYVQDGALAYRIRFKDDYGTKAMGIEYHHQGHLKRAAATKSVILCGGAINTPHLLMLSGVGDPEELKKLSIPTIVPLPGVGKNLQDHLEVYIQQYCTQPITLYKQTRFWYMPLIGAQWFLNRSGPCATNSLEAGGFIKSNAEVAHPDIQLHFLPFAVKDHGRKFPDGHAYQLHAGTMRATSRGSMSLVSRDPRDHPRLDPNYLATEADRADMRSCVRLGREILAQKAFDEFRDREMQPGIGVQTDEEIDAFVREAGDSAYHPSCTCKMGSDDDPMAVTDSEGRVRGAENLRIVDASIMPSVVSGNLNAPVIMMAEKLADKILGEAALPKSTAPVYETKLGQQR